jgi:hypothetical protein
VFDMLDRPSDSAAAALRWARSTVPAQTPTADFLQKTANVHCRAIEGTLSGPIERELANQLLSNFSTDLETIQTFTGHPAVNPTAACWGLLLALGRRDDPNLSTPESAALVSDALDLLSRFGSPRIHEQVHHGWLTSLVNHSATARHWAHHLLVTGLPAAHQNPTGADQRWADTVRRTLERADIRREALAVIVDGVAAAPAPRWSKELLWLDSDLLLRLLLGSACAGVRDAQTTLTALIRGALVSASFGSAA